MSAPRLVYLVATSGHPNYGDELIAATWLRHLARHLPGADVWLDCPNPGQAQLLLAPLHPGLRCTDTLWRLCRETGGVRPGRVAAAVAKAVADPRLSPRLTLGLELARAADVVHLLGGGYVNAIWPLHVGLLAALDALSRVGARAGMTGQGLVPPPANSKPLLRRLVASYDVADVRDAASRAIFSAAAQVSRTGDDVLLDLGPHLYAREPGPQVMVCVQSDLVKGGSGRVMDLVRGLLQAWSVSGADLGLLECMPETDRLAAQSLLRAFPGARLYSFAELWTYGLPAREGQRWISTRFHPHLLAAAAGARGVAVSVNPDYYTVKHRSLLELGTGWSLADIASHARAADVSATATPGRLADAIAVAAQGKAEVAARLYGR